MKNKLFNRSVEQALEAASLLPRYVDSLKEQTAQTAVFAQSQELDQTRQAISELADKISRLVSIFTMLKREYAAEPEGEESFKAVEIHLLSVLKAIQSAQRAQDFHMLFDLLEYELQDNLTQWKIKAIPRLKARIAA